ncbi:MAG: chromosome segregation protein SMC [Burkholderiales bacterium]|nr:chromosome segregation protein SMC [Burkholderiales bacterium]
MRLTHIKLSGFKTFVDPTTIATSGQLVGIVGPNGCGKSNVIDAVRWVLGESKASALRGESMQDVIFNGAGDRKPVSRASVELQFDNSDGRIGGQWGQYTELSIKRVLTRDGDSAYYINNIPVRRRDIYDVFLGTGLGPRAYAIIEQGMISRVIEAKPEELRVFLEEAAGVSKYKERRKETENRLADTREHLSRLEDIRTELSNQLAHLDAQAKVASEYHELTNRHKNTQHLLWFSKREDAARTREKCRVEAAQLQVELDRALSDIHAVEAKLDQLRETHYTANDALHDKQGALYAISTEVSRLEEQLKSAHASETRIAQQSEQINAQIKALEEESARLGEDETALLTELETAAAAILSAEEEEREAAGTLPSLEEAVLESNQQWMSVQQELAQLEQVAELAKTSRDHITRTIEQFTARLDKLLAELKQMTGGVGVVTVADVEDQLAQENESLTRLQESVSTLAQKVEDETRLLSEAQNRWQQATHAMNAMNARQEALFSLQNKIERQDVHQWLDQRGLNECARLWQKIDVDKGWENALEAVLREKLNAPELADFSCVSTWLNDPQNAVPRLTVFTRNRENPHAHASPADDALFYKLKIKDSQTSALIADWLYGVHCIDSVEAALAKRGDLAPGASWVTPEGHLVTAQSVTFFAPDSELHGVLTRQRELSELNEQAAAAEAVAEEARLLLETAETTLTQSKTAWQNERHAIESQQKRCHNLELELAQLKKEAEAQEKRKTEINRECDELRAQLSREEEERDRFATEIGEAQMKLHDEMARRESLRHAKNETEVMLTRGRERAHQAERATSEAKFNERHLKDRQHELTRRRDTLARQKEQQQRFLSELSNEHNAVDWAAIEASLQEALSVRGKADAELHAARETLETVTQSMREAETSLRETETDIEPRRNKIQDARLKEQAAQLQEEQFAQQLSEDHADLDALPEALRAWGRGSLSAEIDRLQKAIAALGAVNLAALEELKAAEERKTYLDQQSADLVEAMTTLENAIRQIDKESRALLSSTFDAVNMNFSRLFPTLFGGGQAKLVLTGEEILDSGVQVIAQPPGKKNASIHLLSGGEKALTATALVFALFQLNPAPFCLLDEVDAPLDDSNAGRFSNLVREMSDKTQFLFITHNKIVMEMATQLLGITMPDPGISRTVAVDIAEALDMATAG